MSIKDEYEKSKQWNVKVLLMNVFHIQRKVEDKKWRIRDTANYFEVSMGLVSENLKLAKQIKVLKKCSNREEALRKIR